MIEASGWRSEKDKDKERSITIRAKGPKNEQRGVALLLTLLALILLSAIGASLIMASNTETRINANYRAEQQAYFGAKAGLEEARERLMNGSPDPIARPTGLPYANGSVVYLTNSAGAGDPVQPWNAANPYFDDELCHENFAGGPANPGSGIRCTAVPAGNNWYTTALSDSPFTGTAAALPYKWVRVTLKENGTPQPFCVNGNCAAGTLNTEICWDGTKQLLKPAGPATCVAAGYENVLLITSMAQTASGARRIMAMEAAPPVSMPVVSAIFTNRALSTGDALNVTGNTEPVCNKPSTYGAESGTSNVTTPGSGNVTGSPAATRNIAGWPYNLPGFASYESPANNPSSHYIYSAETGVTGTGVGNVNPPYTGGSATLGTRPTVNPATGPITSMSGGNPMIYYSPGDTTLGGSGTGVNGYGILVVNGNLAVDVSNGFNYYGLIVVTGNITISARDNASVNPQIHGAIIGGGTFSAPISNMSGSVSIFQDACIVNNAFGPLSLSVLAQRELSY